ncbi:MULTISPECIES: four-helix bundle copper-binding protein [unclassified Caballeronia]|uniref:four-helix bundle copper-binding protein n=1 Tax=unclassified Caballeronia TaxID=2646786 RepID=UPI0015887C0E|nr:MULTISPECIES: four-helix bundle copper-binding protein [unclassified Caballeronia]QSN62830.1 four-helix bundle copper-binding protein [Caballeronia sp. M1242]
MSDYIDCIAALDRCAAACDNCASACIAEGHLPDMEKCIRLDLDCAALCRFTSESLARDTQFMRDFLDLCARICDACADECSRHTASHCQACSDACRKCAEACRAL